MFRLLWVACLALVAAANPSSSWYDHGTIVYQVFPRSFKDSNGDGIGDLNGITSKLDHVKDIGANVLWLSPIFKSPQRDFGYDISNFTDIDPLFGTIADFEQLVAKIKSLGLRVVLDFVPNHTSDEHPWFKKSVQGVKPYDRYFVWRDAKTVNGTRHPPNNWLSNLGGSAWEWNSQRNQYYLHQFQVSQPDLDYRYAPVNEEMKKVLTFWLERGVDGFRIDSMNFLFEDAEYRDEPKANVTGLSDDAYDSLDHIYTKNLEENFGVLKSWRQTLDDYSNRTNSESKLILTEAYVDQSSIVKYYDAGSEVPFNFMFINQLNNQSTAADFKKQIDNWVNTVPKGQLSNWVSDNHDNPRMAARFGKDRIDQINMLVLLLPGVAATYYGDDIGMVDRSFTYNETVDPFGLSLGPERYQLKSRDPERTPYQWDNTTSAGFSSSNHTWLPVNSNYETLNLAAQKEAPESHYKVFKALTALKKQTTAYDSYLKVVLVTDDVLGVVRRTGSRAAVLLINCSNGPVTVDVKSKLNMSSELVVYTASVGSKLSTGSRVKPDKVKLPAAASVVYITLQPYFSSD